MYNKTNSKSDKGTGFLQRLTTFIRAQQEVQNTKTDFSLEINHND